MTNTKTLKYRQVQYLGSPTIPEKENHFIYRYRFQKSAREGSKSFYEVEFSAHKDCKKYEIWEEFEKASTKKSLSRYKQPIFSHCYVYLHGGTWIHTSIVPSYYE